MRAAGSVPRIRTHTATPSPSMDSLLTPMPLRPKEMPAPPTEQRCTGLTTDTSLLCRTYKFSQHLLPQFHHCEGLSRNCLQEHSKDTHEAWESWLGQGHPDLTSCPQSLSTPPGGLPHRDLVLVKQNVSMSRLPENESVLFASTCGEPHDRADFLFFFQL